MGESDAEVFRRLFDTVEPQLRRALVGHLPEHEVADAVSEALAYAWQHLERVVGMERPAAYLFRVAQSRSRRPKDGLATWNTEPASELFEPALPDALAELPAGQASAVWLVVACGWSQVEAAEALEVTPSTISTQVARGLSRLRNELGVPADG
jgi:DNA-directed RNA polymerase specialized sigma24 family protein